MSNPYQKNGGGSDDWQKHKEAIPTKIERIGNRHNNRSLFQNVLLYSFLVTENGMGSKKWVDLNRLQTKDASQRRRAKLEARWCLCVQR